MSQPNGTSNSLNFYSNMSSTKKNDQIATVREPTGTPNDERSIVEGSVYDVPNLDDAILRANGHEAAMPRQFNWLSALGLGFSITNSWVGYLSNFGQNLVYGGPQVCIFSLLAAFCVQFIITTGLSELGSAFPSSGGQYHFCYLLSPRKTRRFAAYIIGWMSTLAWWTVTCSGISLAAVSLVGMVAFWKPDFSPDQWQVYLVYVAVAFVTVIPVFAASRKISWIVQMSLYTSISGFLVFLIVILAMRKQTQPGSFITESGLGTSGWDPGTAWMLGITNAMYAFGGTDGAIHISEEIPHPGRRVPQVMCVTMVIGLCTCFPLLLVLMFCMKDLEAVTGSTLPSMEIVYQAEVTMFLFVWILIVYIICIPAQWVTCGRMAWAFARDNGVPFSGFFSVVDGRLGFPIRATVAAFIFACLYGLLYLASTTAFNSIVTSAVLFLNITYATPQAILLIRGRKTSLPTRYLDLGPIGYFCNAFSVLWIVVLGTFVCFPPVLPVTVGSMNYTGVVMIGLFAVIIGLWFGVGRRRFDGPNIDWALLEEANRAASKGAGRAGKAAAVGVLKNNGSERALG